MMAYAQGGHIAPPVDAKPYLWLRGALLITVCFAVLQWETTYHSAALRVGNLMPCVSLLGPKASATLPDMRNHSESS